MRQFRNLCAAIALTLVFTNATLADDGIMHPGDMPPPPPPVQQDITNPEDPLSEALQVIVLDLLQAMNGGF